MVPDGPQVLKQDARFSVVSRQAESLLDYLSDKFKNDVVAAKFSSCHGTKMKNILNLILNLLTSLTRFNR
jgi:hypothetical protein